MGRLVYPALAEASRDSEGSFHHIMTDLKKVLLPLIGAMLIFSWLAAPYFFTYLYPQAYHDAGWIAQYMVLMIWFMVLSDFHSAVFIAHNEPKITAIVSLGVVALRVVFSLVGYALFELPGFILGMGVGSAFGYLTYKYLLKKRQGYSNYYELLLFVVGLCFIAAFVIGREMLVSTEVAGIVFSTVTLVVLGFALLVYYKLVLNRNNLVFA